MRRWDDYLALAEFTYNLTVHKGQHSAIVRGRWMRLVSLDGLNYDCRKSVNA